MDGLISSAEAIRSSLKALAIEGIQADQDISHLMDAIAKAKELVDSISAAKAAVPNGTGA